jgi:hypothetical protein
MGHFHKLLCEEMIFFLRGIFHLFARDLNLKLRIYKYRLDIKIMSFLLRNK